MHHVIYLTNCYGNFCIVVYYSPLVIDILWSVFMTVISVFSSMQSTQ